MHFKLKNISKYSDKLKTHLLNRFYEESKCQLRRNSSSISVISPSKVLNKSNREKCISLFQSFKPINVVAENNKKRAAVLVPICEVNGQLALLYILRALHLKVNGGEVAFPGGKHDDSDRTLEATALRETYEEIGIDCDKIDVWAKGPDLYRKDMSVTPILGYIGKINPDKLIINFNEASLAFSISLEHLSSAENFRITRFRLNKASVYQTPVYVGGFKRVWGLTAYITHLVLMSLIPEHYSKNIKFQPSRFTVLGREKKN